MKLFLKNGFADSYVQAIEFYEKNHPWLVIWHNGEFVAIGKDEEKLPVSTVPWKEISLLELYKLASVPVIHRSISNEI